MPSRRSHRNSHHGCDQCRERHVKCDEAQPQCFRCQKKDVSCSYRHLLSAYDPFRKSSHLSLQEKSINQYSDQGVQRNLHPCKPFDILQLPNGFDIEARLYQYYASTVSTTVPSVSSSENRDMWFPSIKRQAVRCKYLQQSVICLASVHLAMHNPNSREIHARRALEYQTNALVDFRKTLCDTSDMNCEAAMACAAMFSASAFAFPLVGADLSSWPVDLVKQLKQIIWLLHGLSVLCRLGYVSSIDPNILAYVDLRLAQKDYMRVPAPEAESSLEMLTNEAIKPLKDGPQKDVYVGLLEKLKRDIRLFEADDGLRGLSWVAFLCVTPKELTALLEENDPIALVMMAHWAIALHKLGDHCWWAKNWGSMIVRYISSKLPNSWLPFMDWPAKQIGLPLHVSNTCGGIESVSLSPVSTEVDLCTPIPNTPPIEDMKPFTVSKTPNDPNILEFTFPYNGYLNPKMSWTDALGKTLTAHSYVIQM